MGLLDSVFPKKCLGCNTLGVYLCSECLKKVKLSRPFCPHCQHTSLNGMTHPGCQKDLGMDGLTTIWNYGGVVRKAILTLKYKYATQIGSELVTYMIKQLKTKHFSKEYSLVPIPIHWYRQNTRGFNQSVEVGRAIALAMNWRFIPDLLVKSKSTKSQTDLSGEERRLNLHGVFRLNSKLSPPDSIILFDDVFTTGSTLIEATKVLKEAGVKKVWGLTIAR